MEYQRASAADSPVMIEEREGRGGGIHEDITDEDFEQLVEEANLGNYGTHPANRSEAARGLLAGLTHHLTAEKFTINHDERIVGVCYHTSTYHS